MASLNKKLAAYTGAAVAVGGAYTGAARAAVQTVPFVNDGNGGGIYDSTNTTAQNPVVYFEEDGPGQAAPNSDAGVHVYLKKNGNTTGSGKDNASFISSASGNAGVLVNLPGGYVVGPTLTSGVYSSADGYSNSSSQNSDLEYLDTTTGAGYTPSGFTPDQFSLNNLGYFGVEFNPGGGSQTDYGYVAITYTNDPNNANNVVANGNLVFDDSGASVTVPGGVTVPEPASLALMGLGAVGLLRRKKA